MKIPHFSQSWRIGRRPKNIIAMFCWYDKMNQGHCSWTQEGSRSMILQLILEKAFQN